MLAIEIGDRDVDVGEVVGVEGNALRVAFVEADAQLVAEGSHLLLSLP